MGSENEKEKIGRNRRIGSKRIGRGYFSIIRPKIWNFISRLFMILKFYDPKIYDNSTTIFTRIWMLRIGDNFLLFESTTTSAEVDIFYDSSSQRVF